MGEHEVGQKMLLAFAGKHFTPQMQAALRDYRPAGITLFRHLNVDHPAQVQALCADLQRAARELGLPPLLIAADQEGGQLMAVGEGVTPLPGNMALGAAGSEALAEEAGAVLGRELAAMGVNVDYAPVCDVNINPRNPVIGSRSFGEDPQAVGRLAAAVIRGLQGAGVAAAAKHFPGHGDTDGDSHHGLPSVQHDLERLRRVEFPPFQAAVAAGVRMVMSAHVALPAVDGADAPPATLSPRILQGILRQELGFEGVIVTDAMDMRAIRQGEALGEDALRAVTAGVDLLLVTADPQDQRRVFEHLQQALRDGRLTPQALEASLRRTADLRDWLSGFDAPDWSAVGCAAHQKTAETIAERALTRVRDHNGILPLHLGPEERLGVVMPRPVDLTPADTSSYVTPQLAAELRKLHPQVEEISVGHNPSAEEIAEALRRLEGCGAAVVGTLNAFAAPGQAELVRQVLRLPMPVVAAALRLPYDLAVFPEAPAFVSTYSLLPPSMRALARALMGQGDFWGRLPVSIEGLYPLGHGLI